MKYKTGRRPTIRERLVYIYATKRINARATPTAKIMESFSNSMRAAMGVAAYVPPDPDKCDCKHSLGREHTNHPVGYGCTRCLCLTVPKTLAEVISDGR